MTDLLPLSGLAATLDETTLRLRFEPGVVGSEPVSHNADALRPVLLDPGCATGDLLYREYPEVAPDALTGAEMARRGLRCAALLLRAGALGEEWARTRGQTLAPWLSLPLPEIYEIWWGRALLYLQTPVAREVDDVRVVLLRAGEKAIVPPGWAALLANVGDETLAAGSWRARDAAREYAGLEVLGGMAHFVLAEGKPGMYRFEPNPNYRSVPVPRRGMPHDIPEWGLRRGEPLLTTFRANPAFFRFLTRPQDYEHEWTTLYP